MRVSIHLPNYIPYLGFWSKLLKSDVMVLLDIVQFEKAGWQNRQKVKLSHGRDCWLTVPVHHKCPEALSTIKIDNTNNGSWAKKHLHTLRFNYERSGQWKELGVGLEEIYLGRHERLLQLNLKLLFWVMQTLGIHKELILASSLLGKPSELDEEPNTRIIDICHSVHADKYISGDDAKSYLDTKRLSENGILCEFQEFVHPVYPQRNGKFIPNLGVLDLILNVGGKKAYEIILGKEI